MWFLFLVAGHSVQSCKRKITRISQQVSYFKSLAAMAAILVLVGALVQNLVRYFNSEVVLFEDFKKNKCSISWVESEVEGVLN